MEKFDMHCHTREGSMDAQVSIFEYANTLKSKGFGGMLVTDHNSYDGYHSYVVGRGRKPKRKAIHPILIHKQNKIRKQIAKGKLKNPGRMPKNFVVLKGIEYDTRDAGHMIVVMPRRINLKILELRGFKVERLIRLVHHYGGIIGPAHPFGERYLSYFSTMKRKKMLSIIRKFDFIEIFNACEDMETNKKAWLIAKKYNLPGIAGSDAHHSDCIGTAYTRLPDFIKNEDDLIEYIKEKPRIKVGGKRYYGTTKDHIGKWNVILVQGFFFYNFLAGKFRSIDRYREHLRLVAMNRRGIAEKRRKKRAKKKRRG